MKPELMERLWDLINVYGGSVHNDERLDCIKAAFARDAIESLIAAIEADAVAEAKIRIPRVAPLPDELSEESRALLDNGLADFKAGRVRRMDASELVEKMPCGHSIESMVYGCRECVEGAKATIASQAARIAELEEADRLRRTGFVPSRGPNER